MRYIGINSGTSMDAIDAAIVEFHDDTFTLIDEVSTPFPNELKQALHTLSETGQVRLNEFGQWDRQLGELFAETVQALVKKAHLTPKEIHAIGSHGQTIFHQPQGKYPFTMQIADPNVIAEVTGITVVADLRRRDMAAGGEGAPLAPAFHRHFFASQDTKIAIVNIGGISNVTLIDDNLTAGFDTGPGNGLMDRWISRHLQQPFDKDGTWASKGQVQPLLLELLLADPYFSTPHPKSTGPEYFNLPWLEQALQTLNQPMKPEDVQRTLLELTAKTIADVIAPYPEAIIVGGGARNALLLETLKSYHPGVETSEKMGISPTSVEVALFAWIAKQTLDKQPSNLQPVTGADRNVILGGVYFSS